MVMMMVEAKDRSFVEYVISFLNLLEPRATGKRRILHDELKDVDGIFFLTQRTV